MLHLLIHSAHYFVNWELQTFVAAVDVSFRYKMRVCVGFGTEGPQSDGRNKSLCGTGLDEVFA